MLFKNIMEEVVIQRLDSLYEKRHITCCNCEICRNDIAAIALNHIQPKYVVNPCGELYSRAKYLDLQNSVDLSSAIMQAVEIVRENPRHESK